MLENIEKVSKVTIYWESNFFSGPRLNDGLLIESFFLQA